MSIKKTIKYLFIGLIILLVGKIVFKELFDSRPFKFEKYRTEEQLKEAAQLKFPIGSSIDQGIDVLEKSRAGCYTQESDIYSTVTDCEYMTNLFSFHPIERYEVYLYGDGDRKLAKLGVRRMSGFVAMGF